MRKRLIRRLTILGTLLAVGGASAVWAWQSWQTQGEEIAQEEIAQEEVVKHVEAEPLQPIHSHEIENSGALASLSDRDNEYDEASAFQAPDLALSDEDAFASEPLQQVRDEVYDPEVENTSGGYSPGFVPANYEEDEVVGSVVQPEGSVEETESNLSEIPSYVVVDSDADSATDSFENNLRDSGQNEGLASSTDGVLEASEGETLAETVSATPEDFDRGSLSGAELSLGDSASERAPASVLNPHEIVEPDSLQPTLSGNLPSTLEITASEEFSLPGDSSLQGAQTPSITVEKIGPPEVQVGQPAEFKLRIRNVGRVSAYGVVITDPIPQKTEFIDADPVPDSRTDGLLVWKMATLAPGDESTLRVRLRPTSGGDIGSTARVSFQTHASVHTVATRPELELIVKPLRSEEVLIGESIALLMTVSNHGTGAAREVVLEADLPASLRHDSGSAIENQLGDLKPQESRELELVLESLDAGESLTKFALHASGHPAVISQQRIAVLAPELAVQVSGPKTRYVEREAIHAIEITNLGTATAQNVDLVAQLGPGVKFIDANNQGLYDSQEHAVYWSVEKLAATKVGQVQLTTLPVEVGDQSFQVHWQAEQVPRGKVSQELNVRSLAELVFTVSDDVVAIEIGGETTYAIEVTNTGDEPDEEIRVLVELPLGMEYASSSGATQAIAEQTQNGQLVTFAPLKTLAAKQKAIFKLRVIGREAGDQLVRVQVQSRIVQQTPVIKEESTRVYADQ